jgi:hypothetical protein
MGNVLTVGQLLPETGASCSTQDPSAAGENHGNVVAANDEATPKKLKSLKFFYVGLAWAFGYPSTACLIGYAVSLASGSPAIA